MAEVKWIKITTNMFEDEKIDFIESLPEADAILVVWIKLLTMAGKNNSNGFIFLTEQIPYMVEMLAHRFRRPLNTVKLALETLKNLEMISFDEDGFLNITNWEKHQNIEGLDKIREQTRKRVARYRERQKQLEGNDTSSVTVTDSNETDIDIDIDIEEDKDKDKDIYILSDNENKFLNILAEIENYPLDRKKDLEMYKTLEERYPMLNLLEAIEQWRIYKLDQPLKKNSNARSQINTAFKKYIEWGKCLKGGTSDGKHNGNDGRETRGSEEEIDWAERAGVKSF